MTKTCSRCQRNLPIEDFCKAAVNKDGRSGQCRTCRTERARLRRQSAEVKAREAQQRRDRIAAGVRYPSEQLAQRREATAEERAARVRHRLQRQRVAAARHQASRFGAQVNDLTLADWRDILAQYAGRCAYCGQAGDLWIEHATPMGKGGDNTKANVVPACEPCNRSKARRSSDQFREGLCEAGHRRTAENVYTYPDGRKTACKPCRRAAQARFRQQRKQE